MAFAVVAMSVASCDEVSENERYVSVTPPTSTGTDSTDTDSTDVSIIRRAVLVEEFSGQLCVNCPAAAEALEKMQEANGGADTVVVVTFHAGEGMMLAIGKERGEAMGVQGLATDFGEQLFSNYGLQSEPNAVIDRRSGVVGQPQWLTTIVSSLRREATEALQLSTSYDASTRQLTVNVLGRSSSEGGFAGNVHLWLTEDSIVSVQRLEGGDYNFEHVFNNIFRTSATPIEGSPVTIPYANEPQQVYTATVTLDDVWRPEKMAVVAFVDNSGGVANVARAAVITPGEE